MAKKQLTRLAALRDPRLSLPAFGQVLDMEEQVPVRFDVDRVAPDLQKTVLSYMAEPPRTEDGKTQFLVLLGPRQCAKSTTVEYGAYPLAAYNPGWDHLCLADTKPRANYLHNRVHFLHNRWPESDRSPTPRTNETRQLTFDSRVGGSMRVESMEVGAVGIGQSPDSLHWCLPPSTEVLLPGGSLLEIGTMSVGDTVTTHTGAVARVAAVASRDCRQVTIKVKSHRTPVTSSPEHKHWTLRGKVPAGELRVGDRVGFPRVKRKCTRVKLSVPQPRNSKRPLPPRVSASRAWGRVFGLYLAEGHMRRNEVTFAVHEKEVERTVVWLDAVGLGDAVKVHPTKGSKTVAVVVNRKQLAMFLESHLGRTVGKHWPDKWWTLPGAFLNGMVEGYVDGDGSYDVGGTSPVQRVTSTVPGLVYTLRDVALSIGLGWGTIHDKVAAVRHGRTEKRRWYITWTGDRAREFWSRYRGVRPQRRRWTSGYDSVWVDDDFVWLPIESVERSDDVVPMVDIEVDHPDHSFCLPQFATSNSEIGFCNNCDDQWTNLQPSMSKRRNVRAVFECTPTPGGERGTDFWKEMCDDARKRNGRFIYAFFPMWTTKANVATWKTGWKPDTEELRLMDRYGPLGLTLENLAFRREEMAMNRQLRRNPELFAVYYPFDDLTCWAGAISGTIPKHAVRPHMQTADVDWRGPFMQFKPYDQDALYSIGVDPTGFAGHDHASFQVLECWAGEWEQAATYAENVGDPETFTRELLRVAALYGNPLITVEANGVGAAVLALLIQAGYRNLYYEKKNRPGLTSTSNSKKQMVALLVDALLDELIVHDKDFAHQLSTYQGDKQVEEDERVLLIRRGKIGRNRRAKHHWDKISAMMMAIMGAHRLPRRHRAPAPGQVVDLSPKILPMFRTEAEWKAMKGAEEETARPRPVYPSARARPGMLLEVKK